MVCSMQVSPGSGWISWGRDSFKPGGACMAFWVWCREEGGGRCQEEDVVGGHEDGSVPSACMCSPAQCVTVAHVFWWHVAPLLA